MHTITSALILTHNLWIGAEVQLLLSSAAESHVYTRFHANQTAAALLSEFTLTEGLLISRIS